MRNGELMPGYKSVIHKSWFRILRQELYRRSKSRRKQQREHGDEDDTGVILPVDLIEKILARMPFPDVFKVRVLSRSWRRKFSQASKSGRPSCTLFNELSSAAARWPTYCPVYMTPEGRLMGYNHILLNWEPIVISAYVPMRITHSNLVVGRKLEFAGPFISVHDVQKPLYNGGHFLFDIFVANLQTGRWKTIVFPLQLETWHIPQMLVINESGSEDYKVMVYHMESALDGFNCEFHLFESASKKLTRKYSSYEDAGGFMSSFGTGSHLVYADGNVYLMGMQVAEDREDQSTCHAVVVIKYNMRDNIWSKSISKVQLKLRDELNNLGGVFRCGSKFHLVAVSKDGYRDDYSVIAQEREYNGTNYGRLGKYGGARVFEFCPETLEVEFVSVSPEGFLKGVCRTLMSDENNIYFFLSNCPGRTKATVGRYNVSAQTWDYLPSPPTNICRNVVWASSAYVPGQNPFAPV